jgi:hypothetical protein
MTHKNCVSEISVIVRLKVKIYFWDALKLRIAGGDDIRKSFMEVAIERRKDEDCGG